MEASKQEDDSHDGSDDGDDRKPPAKEVGDTDDEASLPTSPSSSQSLTRKRKGKPENSKYQMRWDEMYGRLCEYHKR